MIHEFLKTVDCSDPAARCGVHHLWSKYLAWLPGDQGRHAKRRDFVAELRTAGYPVGLVGGKMFVGGISLPMRPSRPRGYWTESVNGKMAFHRERGQAEAKRMECAAGCG